MTVTEMMKTLNKAVKGVDWLNLLQLAGCAVSLAAKGGMTPADRFKVAQEMVNDQVPKGTSSRFVNLAIELAYTIYKFRNETKEED